MIHTARNRSAKYWVLALLLYSLPAFSEQSELIDFKLFNRSINQGSEVSYAEQYKGKATDKLIKGVTSPSENNTWEEHSTFTTGLFSIGKNKQRTITLFMRSEGGGAVRSKLLINFRYFDKHSVMVESGGWEIFDVPYEWKQVSTLIAPKKMKQAVSYAEVWFVKYQDADSTGEVNHPVYVSGVEIK